jgi:sialate O-acetylesterase
MKRYFLFCLLLICQLAFANIRLPAVISSNMVLQRNAKVKLWGWGEANEKVLITTSWNHKTDSTVVDGNAAWQLFIETPEAGGPYTIAIKGNNTIQLDGVLIGEVWICSGQSNMEMNYYWGLPQMKEDIPMAFNSNIRFFHVPKITAAYPQQNGEGSWVLADSNSVKWFSAVAYYFGKKINADLDVPIGLIHASWGGTPAEAWTPSEVVEQDPYLKEAAQKLNPSKYWPTAPGYAFNGMLAPLTNYSIAGAIWYQGESNTGTASTYESLFTSMIQSWRSKWQKEFPFYFVQIAPFNYGNNLIGALLREAQLKTLALDGTGMVVTTDLADDTSDIHPRKKREVGHRLASLALKHTYGLPLGAVESPLFSQMSIEKDRVILSFKNTGAGLMAKGKSITGFELAGEDRKFYPAEATILGNTIIVKTKSVISPVAVRYAFSNTAIGNVFNKEGLPLSPFRTDNW